MLAQRRRTVRMTRPEQIRALVFLGLYVAVFPVGKLAAEWALDHFFSWYLSEAMSAAVYYCILAALAAVLFRDYWKRNACVLADFLPENLSALLTALIPAIALDALVRLIPLPVADPAPATWAAQLAYSPAATVAIVVFLVPFLEELLFRGLIFGCLLSAARPLAWAAGAALYALFAVHTFAVTQGDLRYLLLALYYLPLGLAACWCYERGGSLWSAVMLHGAFDLYKLIAA